MQLSLGPSAKTSHFTSNLTLTSQMRVTLLSINV
ncbi:hypothetical protein CCH79_00013503 [Gambusia affinis]|uniref:Uncharacterized protein n=1 Tax=Gambusia affinis TaxID=33528 RepID=A0A315VYX6_GAMAF|nr:hypothetical protein CCH79_00013503 [Gambusia affinis]